jgi:hypothetical protein
MSSTIDRWSVTEKKERRRARTDNVLLRRNEKYADDDILFGHVHHGQQSNFFHNGLRHFNIAGNGRFGLQQRISECILHFFATAAAAAHDE